MKLLGNGPTKAGMLRAGRRPSGFASDHLQLKSENRAMPPPMKFHKQPDKSPVFGSVPQDNTSKDTSGSDPAKDPTKPTSSSAIAIDVKVDSTSLVPTKEG